MRILNEDRLDDLYVIYDTDYNELFTRMENIYGGNSRACFTDYRRNNYSSAKTFSSKELALAYLDSRKDAFYRYRKSDDCFKVMTFAKAKKLLGDTNSKQDTYKAERQEYRDNQRKQSYERQKIKNVENRKIDPGTYKVVFYYSNSWLGGESYTVEAESVDDAFKKAKQKALRQDPYRDVSGYDEKMIFTY